MFLSQEQMWDLPLNPRNKSKHIPHAIGNVISFFVRLFTKLPFRMKVSGKNYLDEVRKNSGALIIANHISYVDVAFLFSAARPKHWIRFIGRENLFPKYKGLLGYLMSSVGAFPIKRDSADRKAIKRAVSFLKEGDFVGIFPEGTRRGKSGKTPSLHAGVALIARMADAPIIPSCARGAQKIKSKGEPLRFPRVEVEFGHPLYLDDFDFLDKDIRLEAISWYAMRECFALFYQLEASQVNMKELFPETRDYSELFEGFKPRHSLERHAICR